MITKLNDTGIFVIPDIMLPGGEYVQVKKHKKKRINKKYLKKYGKVYRAPLQIFVFDNGCYCPKSRSKIILKKMKQDPNIGKTIDTIRSKQFNGLKSKEEREKYLGEKLHEVNKEEKLREMDFLNLSPC